MPLLKEGEERPRRSYWQPWLFFAVAGFVVALGSVGACFTGGSLFPQSPAWQGDNALGTALGLALLAAVGLLVGVVGAVGAAVSQRKNRDD